MNIEEENSQFQGENDKINLADEYETGRKGTATIRGDGHLDINDKGNARKKARKAKKQIRRGEQGSKHYVLSTKHYTSGQYIWCWGHCCNT